MAPSRPTKQLLSRLTREGHSAAAKAAANLKVKKKHR